MIGGPLEWRALLVLVCASAAFTVLCPLVFRRDPARRKLFLVLLGTTLLFAPWWSAAGLWTWPLGLEEPLPRRLASPVPRVLIGIWWGVGLLLMVSSALRVWRGRSTLEALPMLHDAELSRACRCWAQALGLRRPVSVRLGHGACASSLAGPVLVLPPAALEWDADTRDAVLCHELAHLKRRDDRLMLAVRLLTNWYWWMPWLRGMRRRYLDAMEESCDDLASSALGSRERYVTGVVQAARSLARVPARPGGGARAGRGAPVEHEARALWEETATLLGHSHLAARVQRLAATPRPTLKHSDGRWSLLWASLAFVVALTARPAALPGMPMSAAADLVSLTPPAAIEPAGPEAGYRPSRVETASVVLEPRSGAWRPVPGSVRDPLPVYPAAALQRRIAGEVTVELRLRSTRYGLAAAAPPAITSNDPSGLLAAAVTRALAHAGTRGGIGSGLRAVSQRNDFMTAAPGTQLRLRKTYRFVLGTPAPSGAHASRFGGSP